MVMDKDAMHYYQGLGQILGGLSGILSIFVLFSGLTGMHISTLALGIPNLGCGLWLLFTPPPKVEGKEDRHG